MTPTLEGSTPDRGEQVVHSAHRVVQEVTDQTVADESRLRAGLVMILGGSRARGLFHSWFVVAGAFALSDRVDDKHDQPRLHEGLAHVLCARGEFGRFVMAANEQD